MIFVIDDDEIMSECIAREIGGEDVKKFSNAIEAMQEIIKGNIPDLIFLDILLDGPDGFTFLNELVSYSDTSRIPVVVVSSLDFGNKKLIDYGIVGILNKDTMNPEDIKKYVREYAK